MREITKGILLCLATILFMLLFLESVATFFPGGFYRKTTWAHWQEPDAFQPQKYNLMFEYNEVIGYESIPIKEEIEALVDGDDSAYRILVIGDSVSQEGLYVDQYESMLRDRYGNSSVRVVNAGMMGYDPVLESRWLVHRGLELEPEIVILQFNPNDFSPTPIIVPHDDGSWVAYSRRKAYRWLSPALFSKSALYRHFALRILVLSAYEMDVEANVVQPLGEIKNVLEDHDIPFYLLVFPYLEDGELRNVTMEELSPVLTELHLTQGVIDLTPHYENYSAKELRVDGYHPNEFGHEIAATVLYEATIPFLDSQLPR